MSDPSTTTPKHDSPKITEGTIPFIPSNDTSTYKTWYRIVGDFDLSKSFAQGHTRPLVVLHGGPGASYHNVKTMAHLADLEDAKRAVILYDQLGIGNSTHLKEKDTSFWKVELFVEELANLVKFLKLEDVEETASLHPDES